ncbi:unnamed protein product [Dracunculus medinensis]|uniref:Mpv17-like protein 2 n=1 Tax=Dracunculus medinensis TaxID=318479 RepID=A0A0N4UP37_DRAME|nr:unnamed protein product [Dracunculus medinensis]
MKALQIAFSSRYLFVTNTLCYSSLLGVADSLQQYIHGDWDPKLSKDFDKWRTFRFSIMGFILGPMNHFWYRWLDSGIIKGGRNIVVLKKVIADFLSSPAFSSVFISGVALMEGQHIAGAMREYLRKYYRIFVLDVCVWPPTQFFNFWFLPKSCRVVYVGAVQLLYNCFLSYIKHNEADGTPTTMKSEIRYSLHPDL